MRTFVAFILINTIMVVAQLIAATTVLIVAPLIFALIPNANEHVWPWMILMIGATALSLNALRTATR